MSCVILFIADRVAPAFRFCLSNSTLAHARPIRYSFFLSVTHHCNTYTYLSSDLRKDVAICELPRLFSFTEQDFILPYHKTFPKPFGKIENAVLYIVKGKVQQKPPFKRDIE